MEVLYFLIPLSLGMGASGLIAFLWATQNGQWLDLDRPALDLLEDGKDKDDE